VTIKDIAKLAGVSHSTVSRSLSDNPLIPPETRDRIKAIARERGFEVNATARSLSRGKTSCIALIYPEYFERHSINIFFSSLLGHVRQVFEREMVDVIVSFPKNLHSGTSSIQRLANQRRVDGMLIVNNEIAREDLDCLAGARIPYVFLHKRPVGSEVAQADYFCTDHVAGGRIAGERLVAQGRRRLLCVSAIGEEFDARSEGFSRAIGEAGIELETSATIFGDCSFEFGAGEATERVLAARGVDGVFCQTDLMALGLVQGLIKAGRSVPGDLSIVGYDDIDLGSYFRPALTTIHQPLGEIAAEACERLIELLSGEGPSHPLQRLISPSLVIRET
jgi:LacI family transcriptional regulator